MLAEIRCPGRRTRGLTGHLRIAEYENQRKDSGVITCEYHNKLYSILYACRATDRRYKACVALHQLQDLFASRSLFFKLTELICSHDVKGREMNVLTDHFSPQS